MADIPIHLRSYTHSPRPGWTRAAASVLRAGHVRTVANSSLHRARHPGQDLLFCITGKGLIECGGRSFPVRAGELAWIGNEAPHGHRADPDDPWELMWLRFDAPDPVAIRHQVLGENEHVRGIEEGERLAAWFERLFGALERRDAALDLELNQLLATLFLIADGRGGGNGGARPRPLARAIAAMHADLAASWPAEALEELCGVSATHLRRLFQAHLGATPRQWLMQERLNRAQTLLADTELSVGEIGERCGFADVFHFSREFKRHVGSSPAHWRRAERLF